jgi:D-glycero-alpha-D-manno-heptose-7-phosphate kinase
MEEMANLLAESINVLEGNRNIEEFGTLLHEAWRIKKGLGSRISNSHVDDIYACARGAGALGGKIAGAGGGGFMMLFVPPGRQAQVRETLSGFIHVPFKFEFSGSQVVYYDRQENYGPIEEDLAHRHILGFRELEDADSVEASIR